jgi:lysophospholipid acyltransferase (LPLAT)-like uncharacterized protein
MAFKHPLAHKLLALLGYGVGVSLRSTLDVRAVYADARADPRHPECYGRSVHVAWHETLLVPVLFFNTKKEIVLASASGDGEVLAQVLTNLGWDTVRGSTSRGSVSALLKMVDDDHRSPNITVDGPRGPRRVMSQGAIFLASKLELPILCAGIGMHRPWRLKTWDRFAIPRPYSRVRIAIGPLRRVPNRLKRDDLEAYRLWFENQLHWLTSEAEAWADSGRRRAGEIPMPHDAMSPALPYWDPAHAIRLPDSLEATWAELTTRTQRAA